jgi:3-oxoacyl-[acyl-carrier protein] reductase
MTDQKRITITGSSSGLGKALCEALLGKGGWEVYGIDRVERPIHSSSYKHLTCDLTNWKEVDSLVPDFIDPRLPMHVLVNCAGMMPSMLISSFEPHQAAEAFALNTITPLHLAKILLKPLARSKSGHIINLTSIAADVRIPGEIVYSATKAALKNITENMSAELSRFAIRVNAIAPALVETPLTQHLTEHQVHFMRAKQATCSMVSVDCVTSAIISLIDSPPQVSSSTIYVGGISK